MALNTVTTGNTILAADINQLVNVLQKPSGSTEAGKYFIAGFGTTAGQNSSYYYSSLSRNATPVSVTIDQADQGAVNCVAPATGHLTASGVQIYTASSGSGNIAVGGNVTIQY